MSWLTLQGFAWNDYDDEASVALRALIAGDVAGFLGLLPAYGGSLVLRRRARRLPRGGPRHRPGALRLPARRSLALGIAGGVTLAVLAPIALAGSPTTLVTSASTTGNVIFQPWQAWWFLGESGHVVIGGGGVPKPDGYRVPPEWLSPITHPLIVFLVVPLSLAWARVHRAVPRLGGEQILLLLAMLFLLRCVLDPWNIVYYELPFLLALLTWEALCRPDRPPVLALSATAIVWITLYRAPEWLHPDMQSIAFLAWSVPFAAWLTRAAFRRPRPVEQAAPATSAAAAPAAFGRA